MASKRSAFRNRLELAAFLALKGLFAVLPLRAAEAVGRGAARLYRLLDGRRRRLVRGNLALAFPEKPPGELARLERSVFAHFGGLAAELLRCEREPVESLLSRVEVVGLEHARAAASSGRGVFFSSPHLGNWEWAAVVTGAQGFPVTVVVRPLDNPFLDARLTAMRERTGCRIVSKRDAARVLLKTLRDGGLVGILADQRARPPDAVVVPFFGRPASTTTAIARLAAKTGALFLPAVCLRSGPGRWRLTFSEAIDPATFPEEERSVEALTARVTALVESQVRAAPEQWLWLHDRWRS
jgi:KDO2-lipid IV(A) lauroyltransferase